MLAQRMKSELGSDQASTPKGFNTTQRRWSGDANSSDRVTSYRLKTTLEITVDFKLTTTPETQEAENDSQGREHGLLKVAHKHGRKHTVSRSQNNIYVPGFPCVRGNTPNPGHRKADGTSIISPFLLGREYARADTHTDPSHCLRQRQVLGLTI